MNSSINLEKKKDSIIDTDNWFAVLLVVSVIAASVGCVFTQMI
ncbi:MULTISPECIES: hypothetical protein [unclassified Spirosoma]|nr:MULTISPECIES: hypothetical protein [unclassified Spirosoma]